MLRFFFVLGLNLFYQQLTRKSFDKCCLLHSAIDFDNNSKVNVDELIFHCKELAEVNWFCEYLDFCQKRE